MNYWNNRFRPQTLRGLHAAEDLARLQAQLADIYGIAIAMSQRVDLIEDQVHDMKSSLDDPKEVERNAVIASSVQMPVLHTILIGRDAVVKKIADHLVIGDIARSRIFILAPGITGKSTALAVTQRRTVACVSCVVAKLANTTCKDSHYTAFQIYIVRG